MSPTDANRHAARFFRTWAGWSYNPATETPDEGKRRTGRELAAAERWAQRNGYHFKWVDDPGPIDPCSCGDPECPGEYGPAEGCIMYNEDSEPVQSLWSITGATPQYRRVIQAELANEQLYRVKETG